MAHNDSLQWLQIEDSLGTLRDHIETDMYLTKEGADELSSALVTLHAYVQQKTAPKSVMEKVMECDGRHAVLSDLFECKSCRMLF